MRIDVQDCGHFGDQTRAYAEYRVFSTLRDFGDVIRHALVTLHPAGGAVGGGPDVVCRVTVTLCNDQRHEAAARGRHAYGAIERVARRIRVSMPGLASTLI